MTRELILFLFAWAFVAISAELGEMCRHEDALGNWTFYIGKDPSVYKLVRFCEPIDKARWTFQMELRHPNVAVDEFGNVGTWTRMLDVAFEVDIHGRKYFTYFKFNEHNCNETEVYKSSDLMGRDWICFKAKKNQSVQHRNYDHPKRKESTILESERIFRVDDSLIQRINSDPSILWSAKKYKEFENMTVAQLRRLVGGTISRGTVKPVEASKELKDSVKKLPEEFDWRNVNGVNYISPVRKQGHCGSCYAMSSTGMNEARLNIATRGKINVTLSPQDIIDCSFYSRGCAGGYDFSTAGKYAENFGMIEESCYKYTARTSSCNMEKRNECKKYFFTKYEYIGGYYGNCSEEAMMLALVNHGPIIVNIQFQSEMIHYSSGVFHSAGLTSDDEDFIRVNHSVMVVGYGVSNSSKYWIVKNSYGEQWGEHGYFKVRRGTNECGIESAAFQAFPIF